MEKPWKISANSRFIIQILRLQNKSVESYPTTQPLQNPYLDKSIFLDESLIGKPFHAWAKYLGNPGTKILKNLNAFLLICRVFMMICRKTFGIFDYFSGKFDKIGE